MKRASSASKTRSAAPGDKRKPRRQLAAVKKALAPAKRKPIARSQPVVKRKPVKQLSAVPKRKAVAKSKPVVKHQAKSTPATPPATKNKSVLRRPPMKKSRPRRPRVLIPAALLEGDAPVATAVTGPGEKFALGPRTPIAHFAAEAAPLPEAYGTGRLYVTPRDPHWLYAHWDLTPPQLFRHNARSVDRHLILRLHEGEVRERPTTEMHVHPESRYWFAHVERADAVYVTELGYYQTGRRWTSLAISAPTRTPPDRISSDTTLEFATIPLDLPFETMLELVREGVPENLPLARAVEQLRATRQSVLPGTTTIAAWTPAQEQALAKFHAREQPAPGSPSSHDNRHLMAEPAEGELSSLASGEFYFSSFFGGSSPWGGGPAEANDFRLQVNVELIVYGATEPTATVTCAGQPVPLRADGSFAFRSKFPDGQYELLVAAAAADGLEQRAVELKFTRATELAGDVEGRSRQPELDPLPQDWV